MNFKDITLLKPWEFAPPDAFVDELKKEVLPGHLLYGKAVIALANRVDCDDVLFFAPEGSPNYFVVHLTWTSKTEPEGFPWTESFTSLQDWIDNWMKPDLLA